MRIFKSDRESAIEWCLLCKKDKLIWFFISRDNCVEFLTKIKM